MQYAGLDVHKNFCQAIIMTKDGEIVNDTFNIGARKFGTMKADYQAVLSYAGHGKRVKGFPAWLAVAGLKVLELLGLSPLYKWIYETAGKDSFVAIEKAQKRLEFTPKYSNQDALIRNYKWYLDSLSQFEHASGISHRVPWNQGILKLVKLFF